jgi:hypothetical protein
LPRIERRSKKRHASEFVDYVLSLKPRVAAFDCDGTLWAGDAGESFFRWELDKGLVAPEIAEWARQRYAEYRAGQVSEDEAPRPNSSMKTSFARSSPKCALW